MTLAIKAQLTNTIHFPKQINTKNTTITLEFRGGGEVRFCARIGDSQCAITATYPTVQQPKAAA